MAEHLLIDDCVPPLSRRERFLLWLDPKLAWILKSPARYAVIQWFMLLLAWTAFWIFFKVFSRTKIIGKKNLRHSVGQLFVPNHQSLIDSFLIGVAVIGFWEAILHPERIPWNTPDAKNFLSRPVFGRLFQVLKTIPIDRTDKNMGTIRRMLRDFSKALRDSNLVLFFEGTRSRNGTIGQCQDGIAVTIEKVQPIVVPILLQGMREVMPTLDGNRIKDFSRKNIRLGKKVYIVIGKPVDFSDIIFGEGDKREQIKARVRQSVLDLQTKLPAGVLVTPLT